MMKFIDLILYKSLKETSINFDTVSEIRPMENGGTKIYFNFNTMESTDVKESPVEIKALLQDAK